jgi:hypothetical protein
MKSITILLISTLISNIPALSQSINRFSIQTGYLYSTSTLTPTTTYAIGLPDFDPKPGFYVGLTYEHQLSTLLTTELEFTYQQKGYIIRVPYVNSESINTYRYLGITPMLGIRLIKNLRFLLGPQVNLLVNKSTRGLETKPLTDANCRLEVGLMGRVSYQFSRVGLTAGYFKGLKAYYKPDFYYLTNQNWQLGLFYQLNKKGSY